MSIAVYVIDTSYLVELFHCEGFCDETASRMVHKRFEAATRKGGRFYVPLPCLFELGDHIADVKREDSRRKLANKLLETVRISLLSGRNSSISLGPICPSGGKTRDRTC